MQALLGLNDRQRGAAVPRRFARKLAVRQARADAHAAKLQTGGFDEALTRAGCMSTRRAMLDQRCAFALNVARQHLMHLSLAEFKVLVREQFFLLQLERERAVEALASLVPEADARRELLRQVQAIVGAGDPPTAAERDRLTRLSGAACDSDRETSASCNHREPLIAETGRPSSLVLRRLLGVSCVSRRTQCDAQELHNANYCEQDV